jgi:hypothetical protein
LNAGSDFVSDIFIMLRLTGLALVAAAAFATTSVYAADGAGCCAKNASNHGKKECCSASYAKLNLSPEQKTKLDALQAQCDKAGCTKESMAKFMKSAKGVLSKEQFTMLKAEQNRHAAKTQS